MKAESININWDIINPAGIFGPIFDKELRVSSRRKRNYYLRSAYILLLCFFIYSIWLIFSSINNLKSASLYQVSRSAETGRLITTTIIWFQFLVSQLLAIVMLSSSISDEIRAGTLNVLLTTPVNSFQIVIGKFFSKLLQIFLLLAVSLPLLAILRVFGGTPWNFVLFSLLITLTSVILAGSLSLFLSLFIRKSYHVIVIITLIYIVLFGVIPVFSAIFRFGDSITLKAVLLSINPFWALISATRIMSPGSSLDYDWIIHCLFILGVSVIFLGISIRKVRSAAFRDLLVRHKNTELNVLLIKDKKVSETKNYYEYSNHIKQVHGVPITWKESLSGNQYPGRIKHVTGNPIIWKENYGYFFGKGIIDKIATIGIYLICIFGVLMHLFLGNFPYIFLSMIMSAMYFILMLRLAISTAGSLASEKEARTLPILLVTPLEDKDIILGKIKAALRRNISIIVLYFIMSFVLYSSFGLRDMMRFSQMLYQIPISIVSFACSILFIVGCGSYFGIRMKNSTSAVAATIITYLISHPLFGALNPIRWIFLLFFTRILPPRSFSWIISLTSSFITVIPLGLIGFYLLRKSILNLRRSIF